MMKYFKESLTAESMNNVLTNMCVWILLTCKHLLESRIFNPLATKILIWHQDIYLHYNFSSK